MFNNPSYIPPSPITPASPITPLDPYVMADFIQGTITLSDPSIAAEIAEHIVLHNISGAEFLGLSRTYLRKLSKDNDKVFKQLSELQNVRIFPNAIPSSSTLSFSSIFSEPSSSIRNFRYSRILEGLSGEVNNMGNAAVIHCHADDSGSSAKLGTQILGDFNNEPWDFSDEDDLRTSDVHATVAEGLPLDDMNLPNHSLHPVNPALENGSPLASTSSLEETISIIHAHTATTSTSDDATQVHSAEETHNSELQAMPSESINADDTSIYELNESQLVINPLSSHSASRLDGEYTHLQNESVLASPVFSSPSTRSSSPLSYLSYVDSDDDDLDAAILHSQIHLDSDVPIPHTTLDPNIPIEHDTPPIISRPSSPSPEPLTQVFLDLDISQLESSLSCSLDHPQTTLDPNILIEHDRSPIISIPSTLAESWQITEEEEALEPPCLPASEPAVQTMIDSWNILIEEDEEALEPPRHLSSEPAASDTHFDVNEALNGGTHEAPQRLDSSEEEPDAEAIHENDSSRFSNTGSIDRRDSFASNETHESIESCQSSPQSSPSGSSSTLPLEPNNDINDSNDVDTATFTLPIDIIPMTPPGSPIFEGLSQYMILGAVLGVNQDDVSTPVQHDIPTGERTLRPSSEAPPFGLPSSSGNEQSLRNAQQATNPPESPGPNAVVPIELASDAPYPHLPHVLVWNSDLGRSRSPSTLEYMQSGILRLMPTFFALRRETIDRTT